MSSTPRPIATRRLAEPDRKVLEAFLAAHPDHTLFLQGNLAASGFVDEPRRYCGVYAGAFDAAGELVGVAAGFWNNNYIVFAPGCEADVVDEAWSLRGGEMAMVLGPYEQVRQVLTGLGLEDVPTTVEGREVLYSLALSDLAVPDALTKGPLSVRRAQASDIDVLTPWFAGYAREALGIEGEGDAWLESIRARAQGGIERANIWIAFDGDLPVAKTEFNTRTAHCVQVGGVWTPPDLRGRGYARAAVAASLIDARDEGVARSVLFTPEENTPARKCYEGLGYRETGNYCVHGFKSPVTRT